MMSILRLHWLYVISVSTDPTWDNVGAATWCKYFNIQAQSNVFETLSYSFLLHISQVPTMRSQSFLAQEEIVLG
jgi:hypothetical protein